MQVVFSETHRRHRPAEIVARGRGIPHWEVAERAEALIGACRALNLPVIAPADHGMGPVAAVHDPGYLGFLETIWPRWRETDPQAEAIFPSAFPGRHMTGRPTGPLGEAGYYCATMSAPIVEGTWAAALASAQTAVTAADLIADGATSAYALCRPPGHHAFGDLAGGFCYLNNVAIAAERLRCRFARVAILDFDVHHGNGTQGIFYRRPDVYFVSLHGDPADFFPFFAGYTAEDGADEGRGYTLNLPLPPGTADAAYLAAFDHALGALRRYAPDALLVSAGFDAYEADPIGCLAVTTPGFGEIGRRIGGLGLPTLLVQEGGYNVEALGANLRSFLEGFLSAHGA